MKGNPKYKFGDHVKFKLKGETISGTVYIVDQFGTFEDDSDVSYDILNADHNCIYKHIREDKIF
jgi:hypothetical protein